MARSTSAHAFFPRHTKRHCPPHPNTKETPKEDIGGLEGVLVFALTHTYIYDRPAVVFRRPDLRETALPHGDTLSCGETLAWKFLYSNIFCHSGSKEGNFLLLEENRQARKIPIAPNRMWQARKYLLSVPRFLRGRNELVVGGLAPRARARPPPRSRR